jgi:hypothetical protein
MALLGNLSITIKMLCIAKAMTHSSAHTMIKKQSPNCDSAKKQSVFFLSIFTGFSKVFKND